MTVSNRFITAVWTNVALKLLFCHFDPALAGEKSLSQFKDRSLIRLRRIRDDSNKMICIPNKCDGVDEN